MLLSAARNCFRMSKGCGGTNKESNQLEATAGGEWSSKRQRASNDCSAHCWLMRGSSVGQITARLWCCWYIKTWDILSNSRGQNGVTSGGVSLTTNSPVAKLSPRWRLHLLWRPRLLFQLGDLQTWRLAVNPEMRFFDWEMDGLKSMGECSLLLLGILQFLMPTWADKLNKSESCFYAESAQNPNVSLSSLLPRYMALIRFETYS